jgi:hypothetical protein
MAQSEILHLPYFYKTEPVILIAWNGVFKKWNTYSHHTALDGGQSANNSNPYIYTWNA